MGPYQSHLELLDALKSIIDDKNASPKKLREGLIRARKELQQKPISVSIRRDTRVISTMGWMSGFLPDSNMHITIIDPTGVEYEFVSSVMTSMSASMQFH